MKKGLLVVSLVVTCLLWTNTVRASELTDDYFDIATNYFNSNNLAKSLEYLDLIISIEPDNLKAKVLHDKISPPKTNPTENAKDMATVFNAVNPGSVVITEVPQEDLSKVVYDSDYYCKKGQDFYTKRDYATAIEYFHKSIALNNKNAQAYNNLAMSYWCKGNADAAIKFFKKANMLNKVYTQPLVNLSNVYKQLQDPKKQLACLKKAVKLNPNDYLAYYWLGNYYKGQNNYTEAIKNYKEVVKINPKYSQAYLNLAICFFETEEFNYTLVALSQYQEFYPESDFAYYLMARADLAMSHYDLAKEHIQKAIQLRNNSEYEFELAKINYYLEDYLAAIDSFQELLKSGENAEYFNYVGLCNYKTKNIDVAIANFNKAIELDGLRPIYYYNLAQCYKSLGDKKNYLKYVNTATKITPVNYQDFIDLSCIYYDNGNPSYAVNSLNNAISKYPNVKSLYLAKLKLYESLSDNLHYNETKDTIEKRFNE